MKILKTKRTFKKEFKRQLKIAIDAAIGFTIAFAWRNSIFDTFQRQVARFLDLAPEHFTTEIYTALSITIVGVLLIFITSKLLRGD